MIIGYARVSTTDQNLDLQKDALNKVGCDRIFTDEISGSTINRKGLSRALDTLREGDTLVIWRLDRLGRSLRHLIDIINDLNERGIGLRSIEETIDTSSSTGKLIFHIFGALSEFERNLIRERTKAGLESARARGRLGGRPKKLDNEKRKHLKILYCDQKLSISEIARITGVSKPTVYSYIRSDG